MITDTFKRISGNPIARACTLLAGIVVLSASSCEERVTEAIACQIEDFDVTTNITAQGTQPNSAVVGVINAEGEDDLPSGIDLEAISIGSSQLTFTGTGTGTLLFALAVNDTVVAFGSAGVTNGALSAAPGRMQLGGFTAAQVQTILDAVPTDLRDTFVIASSQSQARAVVSRAVRNATFRLASAALSTGDVAGTATLSELTFHLDCD